MSERVNDAEPSKTDPTGSGKVIRRYSTMTCPLPEGPWSACSGPFSMPPAPSLAWLEPFGELRDGPPRPVTGARQKLVPIAPADDPAKRAAYLDALMQHMEPRFRVRWCAPTAETGGCACLGCADMAGHLCDAGFTREEWQAWRDAAGRT